MQIKFSSIIYNKILYKNTINSRDKKQKDVTQ